MAVSPANTIHHPFLCLLSDSAMLDMSVPPKKGTYAQASLAADLQLADKLFPIKKAAKEAALMFDPRESVQIRGKSFSKYPDSSHPAHSLQ
jgi:hypothetical protein